MINKEKLKEYKKTVQNIIDKYLPDNKRFSVKDFNEEQLGYLCKILVEKDNKKRKALWDEIKNKLNYSKYKYDNKYYDILKNKELFDNGIEIVNDLGFLCDDIDIENKTNTALDNLDF